MQVVGGVEVHVVEIVSFSCWCFACGCLGAALCFFIWCGMLGSTWGCMSGSALHVLVVRVVGCRRAGSTLFCNHACFGSAA